MSSVFTTENAIPCALSRIVLVYHSSVLRLPLNMQQGNIVVTLLHTLKDSTLENCNEASDLSNVPHSIVIVIVIEKTGFAQKLLRWEERVGRVFMFSNFERTLYETNIVKHPNLSKNSKTMRYCRV